MNRQENAGGGGSMFILLGVGLLAFWYISKGGLSSFRGTTTPRHYGTTRHNGRNDTDSDGWNRPRTRQRQPTTASQPFIRASCRPQATA